MGLTARSLDWVTELGLVGLLLFAPLPFGAVDPWATAVVVIVVAALVAVAALRMLATGALRIPRTPLLLPGLVGLALGIAQLRVGGSVNPYATSRSLLLYAAYLGCLLVLATHLVTRPRVLRLLWILVGWGAALAVVGLLNRFQGRVVVPWFPDDFATDRLVSTFVNPNHQALYFELVFFLALGLLLRPARTGAREDGWRPPSARRLGRALLLAGALAVIAAAFGFTMSRGGLAAMVAGLVTVCAVGLIGRAGRRTVVPVLLVVAVVAATAAWLGAGALFDRVVATGRDPLADKRWVVWERSLHALGEAPLAGTGLGTYQDVFPRHRPPGLASNLVVDHAHNDYLELAVELGVPGVLVVGWGLAALLAFVLRRWVGRHDPFVRGVVLGGLGGLTAVLVHSALDFGLRIPANALLAVVLGALLPNVVALRTRRGAEGGVELSTWDWTPGPKGRIVAGAAAVALVAAVVWVEAPVALADLHVQRAAARGGGKARAAGAVTMRDLLGAVEELREAVRLDPDNPAVHGAIAEVAEELALRVWNYGVAAGGQRLGPSADDRVGASQDHFATAYAAYERSLRLNPRAARMHDRFGRFLGHLEAVRQVIRGSSTLRVPLDPRLAPLVDAEESLIPRALAHLGEGVRLDPLNPYRHRNLAAFALVHPTGPDSTRVVVDGFRTVLSIDREFLPEVADRLESRGASGRALLRAAMPRLSPLWLDLARRWDRAGQREDALSAYEEALALAPDPGQELAVRLAYSDYLVRTGSPRAALHQAQRAIVLAPQDHRAFGALAGVHEALRDWDGAERSLTTAIALARGRDRDAWFGYQNRLADAYRRSGRPAEAIMTYRELVRDQTDPAHHRAHAHAQLAQVLEEAGRASEALEEYRAAERLSPGHAGLRFSAAQAYLRQGLLQEALPALEAVVASSPSWTGPRVVLADLYVRMGSLERAKQQYRQVLADDPRHDAARRALAALDGAESRVPGAR
jgi:tetratricopeptide (TPR) repeat protein/O-antigen ligase